MKDSYATINYEDGRTIKIKGANPQQLGSAVHILGRIKYLDAYFKKIIERIPVSVIDVGANIGAYSLMFNYLWPDVSLVAIEPSSYNQPYLKYNIGHIPEIDIRPFALGSERGSGVLAIPTTEQKIITNDYHDTHTGCLSLYGESDNMREKVDIFPLDELDIPRPVGFIKIDVEGHEVEVIRGARKTIEEDKPLMLIEFHEANMTMAGTTKNHLFRLLAGMGYFPTDGLGPVDLLFRPVGIGYILDRLDYTFKLNELAR